jgi:hypothetical protein
MSPRFIFLALSIPFAAAAAPPAHAIDFGWTSDISSTAASPAPLPPGALSSWVSRGFSLPCREPADDYGPTAHSVFAPDGESFIAFTNAYLSSAGAFLSDEARWPLDDASLVRARAARVFDARDSSLPIPFPHVARVDVPANSTVALFGDLHGSFHSLARALWAHADAGRLDAATLRVAPGVFFIFLGDYVDRGVNGVETLALLLALKAANPSAVFLARGNHEDVLLNDGPSGGFAEELAVKFPRADLARVSAAVQRVYESLPQAVFLGADAPHTPAAHHVQLCHGGLEVGFNPAALLGAAVRDAASGARVGFALIHGFARGAWLRDLLVENASVARRIPRDVAAQLQDVGAGSADPRPPAGAPASASASSTALDSEGRESSPALPAAPPEAPADAPRAEWLARARAARVAAAGAWNDDVGLSGAWPTVPLGTALASGFLWADFVVDAGAAAVYSPGRGVAWGLPVTAALLRQSALVGIFRAHQHNNAPATGPMLSRIVDGGGAHVLWGGAAGVATLLSGAHVPGLGFGHDAHALLRVTDAAPESWVLDLCASTPGAAARAQPELAALADGPDGAAVFGTPSRAVSEAHAACSVHRAFTCKATGWAAARGD